VIGFLHPLFLWALPLATLPLVLHLVARRQPPTVLFPAVRYLQQATREHQRRLKLEHWLLLAVRTLLVLAVILAAAGPTVAREGLPGHAPTAVVVVLDNSASSAAVAGGTSRLALLRGGARDVLAKATPDDALWLLTADGTARRGEASHLLALVDSLSASPARLDLGGALTVAQGVLADESRPSEIVLLSDLQSSALGQAELGIPVVVVRPEGDPPSNAGIASLDPGPQPWSPDGGSVRVTLSGETGRSVPVSVSLGDRPPRQGLGTVGETLTLPLTSVAAGWQPVTVRLDQDEFRLDDEYRSMVRVAPVAGVTWDATDRYLDAAAATLRQNGRIVDGREVTLGGLGAGASVVQPPAEASALGALNRALERRGVLWRYSDPVGLLQVSDSGPLVGREEVRRRYRLEYTGGAPRGVLATVAGQPWIARSGDIVLLGSRLEPEWTALPLSAGFVPLVDALVNRLARGEQASISASPGAPVLLPDLATEVRLDDHRWTVEGGAPFRPPGVGTYFLLAGADTLGAIAVNVDPRESDLTPATDAAIHGLWPDVRIVGPDGARAAAFAAGARGDLRGPLLWAALLFGLIEIALASGRHRKSA
jgi:aerotolerance regulator-like protein/VWA domain-containing protein